MYTFYLNIFQILFFSTIGNCQNFSFTYGQHFPNGLAAVEHLYSSKGTWKNIIGLIYKWNYYQNYATFFHPFNPTALIAAANGPPNYYTTRDANGYLLCDSNRDLNIGTNEKNCGYAFHEHNGLGVNGQVKATAFTNFWLDDNQLAQFMSQAYSKPISSGVINQPGFFMRWKIIGGNSINWTPYGTNNFDTISLDGLYYIATGNISGAIDRWNRHLTQSNPLFDNNTFNYVYRAIDQTYYLGLWKILTDNLIDINSPLVTVDKYNQLVQHSVALRSYLLQYQQFDTVSNQLIGWITGINNNSTLINTETTSCSVLGLSASTKYTFEIVNRSMINNPNGNYVVNSQFFLSAIYGSSNEGYMYSGPDLSFPESQYTVQFYIRIMNPTDGAAQLDIFDSTLNTVLISKIVNSGDVLSGNKSWCRISLSFTAIPLHNYQFRIYWFANTNLDVAFIRVK